VRQLLRFASHKDISLIRKSSASPINPSTSSTNPVPVGGIVAGAVVGGIAIFAILVFGWYKVKTHHPAIRPENFDQESRQYFEAPAKRMNTNEAATMSLATMNNKEQTGGRLQYDTGS
jgi:hypothetical protein